MRTVAVTGGSGQLGTLVLQRLIKSSDVAKVVSLDQRPPTVGSDKLCAVTCDIRDPELSRHLEGADAIIHCAFIISGHERSPLFRSVNVEGAKNVFRAAVAAGIKTMVFVSSVSAYGCVAGHPVPIVETTPRVHQPDFPYAACKFDVEAFLDEVEPQHPDIAISRIRANVLIGRHMPHLLGFVMRLGWLPDLGVPLPIVWDEDVADLMLLAADRGARGAFNAAAEESMLSPDLAEKTGMTSVKVSRILFALHTALYELLTRLKLFILSDPSWVTKTRAPLIASSERARRELGWTPRCPTAVSVVNRYREVSPWRLDVGLLLLLRALSILTRNVQASLADRSARLFLCLNGRVAGDFSLLLEAGRITVRAGAPSAPTSTITMADQQFRDLLAGRLTVDAAFASNQIDFIGSAADRDVFGQMVAILGGGQPADHGWRERTARLATRCC